MAQHRVGNQVLLSRHTSSGQVLDFAATVIGKGQLGRRCAAPVAVDGRRLQEAWDSALRKEVPPMDPSRLAFRVQGQGRQELAVPCALWVTASKRMRA